MSKIKLTHERDMVDKPASNNHCSCGDPSCERFKPAVEVGKEESPIHGLSKEQFEEIRLQIIEYIKMYHNGGEPIAAYKILKLVEPLLTTPPTQ